MNKHVGPPCHPDANWILNGIAGGLICGECSLPASYFSPGSVEERLTKAEEAIGGADPKGE